MDEKKKKFLQGTAKAGGAFLGSAIGTAIAGPIGGVGGALAGTGLELLVEWGVTEISSRVLSKAEKKKVETVYDIAINSIRDKINSGIKLRDDGFFDSSLNERSPAEELLEGVLLCAQREHEERKLKYLANLYSNLCFRKEISREVANSLIKLANQLTYRDYVIMKCVVICQHNEQIHEKSKYTELSEINDVSIATDTYALFRQGLLSSRTNTALFGPGGIDPSDLRVAGMGSHLYSLMELETIPYDDLFHKTFAFFSDTIIEV